MDDSPFTSADFHTLIQKQVANAVAETLVESKLDWKVVRPFLEAARSICRSDFQGEGARIRFYAVQPDGEADADSEEAFLGISVTGEDGQNWLSETYWVSDIALADGDPEQVRRVVAALERSLAKMNEWLAANEKGGPHQTEPPSRSA